MRLTLIYLLLFNVVAAATFAQGIRRPQGIYMIGNVGQSFPDPEVLARPYVDGFTVRVFWEDLEPQKGDFDFSIIEAALQNLASYGGTKRMTLEIFSREVPSWLLAEPGIVTYDARNIAGGSASGQTITVPLPWDPITLERWDLFVATLAAHQLYDEIAGIELPLASHSLLAHINAEIPGLGGIRDQGGLLVATPEYDRALLLDAISQAIHSMESRFTAPSVFLLYFDMDDGTLPHLGDVILTMLQDDFFPAPGREGVGLFRESWACDQPVGRPGDALFDMQDETFILLQALQGWVNPFQDPEATDQCMIFDPPQTPGWQTGDRLTDNEIRKTSVSGPEIGIIHGMQELNCYYFELYVGDLRHEPFADDLQQMHDLIWQMPPSPILNAWAIY